MNSNTAPPARASSSPQPAPNGGLSTKASGWAGAGGAGGWGLGGAQSQEGPMAEDHQEASWDAPVTKQVTKAQNARGQLAAQLNLRGIRVDTGW